MPLVAVSDFRLANAVPSLTTPLVVILKTCDMPDLAQSVEGLVAFVTQFQGLAGLDKAKPIGVAVNTDGAQFQVIGFVPVTDLGKLLSALQGAVGEATPEIDLVGSGGAEGERGGGGVESGVGGAFGAGVGAVPDSGAECEDRTEAECVGDLLAPGLAAKAIEHRVPAPAVLAGVPGDMHRGSAVIMHRTDEVGLVLTRATLAS
mgnify:CR=1 FL=1